MYSESDKSNPPVLEVDSPLEFILVGTTQGQRNVIVKSKGAGIDLISYAQEGNFLGMERLRPSGWFFPFTGSGQLEPVAIHSHPIGGLTENEVTDNRDSTLTLVWRGVWSGTHRKGAEIEFNLRIPDIVSAFEEGSSARMEWALAGVIDYCLQGASKVRRRRLWMTYAFWFTILLYGILFFGYYSARYAEQFLILD